MKKTYTQWSNFMQGVEKDLQPKLEKYINDNPDVRLYPNIQDCIILEKHLKIKGAMEVYWDFISNDLPDEIAKELQQIVWLYLGNGGAILRDYVLHENGRVSISIN